MPRKFSVFIDDVECDIRTQNLQNVRHTRYRYSQSVVFVCRLRSMVVGCHRLLHAKRLLTNKPSSETYFNPLTPNDPYRGRTAPLTSKRCILYIYSTNIGTEYFKHGINSPFFPLQNAVCFIIIMYLVPVLFTFYKQVC